VISPDGYELGSAFAKDMTGVAYRAVQIDLDRPVTYKQLRPELRDKPRAVQIFEEERARAVSLEHKNLLLCMDTGSIDGVPYFITESTAEPTLAEALKPKEPLLEQRAVSIALGIAYALHHLAKKELIYKNVNPKQVLLPRPAAPKLITFRYIKALDEAPSFRKANVQSGQYCAPELMRDDLGPVTGRINVYALGALLYHMLSGKKPVEGNSARAREVHAAGLLRPLREVRPQMRDRAYAVVGRLLTHDPKKRPDTAAAVALLEAYRDDPLLARPLRSRRLRHRRR